MQEALLAVAEGLPLAGEEGVALPVAHVFRDGEALAVARQGVGVGRMGVAEPVGVGGGDGEAVEAPLSVGALLRDARAEALVVAEGAPGVVSEGEGLALGVGVLRREGRGEKEGVALPQPVPVELTEREGRGEALPVGVAARPDADTEGLGLVVRVGAGALGLALVLADEGRVGNGEGEAGKVCGGLGEGILERVGPVEDMGLAVAACVAVKRAVMESVLPAEMEAKLPVTEADPALLMLRTAVAVRGTVAVGGGEVEGVPPPVELGAAEVEAMEALGEPLGAVEGDLAGVGVGAVLPLPLAVVAGVGEGEGAQLSEAPPLDVVKGVGAAEAVPDGAAERAGVVEAKQEALGGAVAATEGEAEGDTVVVGLAEGAVERAAVPVEFAGVEVGGEVGAAVPVPGSEGASGAVALLLKEALRVPAALR